MSKTITFKYDVGDKVYTMIGDTPSEAEVVNFKLSYNKKLPIEDRIQYEVSRVPAEKQDMFSLTQQSFINVYKGLDEVFDTKEELIESLTKKIKEL